MENLEIREDLLKSMDDIIKRKQEIEKDLTSVISSLQCCIGRLGSCITCPYEEIRRKNGKDGCRAFLIGKVSGYLSMLKDSLVK